MKIRPLAFSLLLALAPAATLPPRVALAQADDATTKMARQRFQEGVAFYDKGQFEGARAAFLQAYALRKHPVVLMNLAQSSLKSGHALEAAHYFQQFLKEYSTATEAQRNDANKGLSEARTKLGRIDVLGAPNGAEIYVDDERVGPAPLDHSVDVEPGTHTVRCQDQSVQVTANAGVGATARLGSASAAAATPATPPAETPPSEPAATPPAEEAATPPPPPPPPPPTASEEGASHPWGWVVVTGAVTIAGAVTAAVMAGEKSSAQNNANAASASIEAIAGDHGCYNVSSTSPVAGQCAALNTDLSNVNSDATIANVGLGVGSVALVGLIISTVFLVKSYNSDDSKPASSASALPVTVTPVLSRGFGGLSFGGTF
jgi:tetratricopeptide (TPR) repeat protein